MAEFSTDDVALAIEIPGVYDGTAVYLMKDGSLVNRFRLTGGWGERRAARVDAWIAEHGEEFRSINMDLLDPARADEHRGEHESPRPTTPITDTPDDFARALRITPEADDA